MTLKSIIADSNKGENFNGDNYDIWSHKILYVLEEQNMLECTNHVLNQQEKGNPTQYRRDFETYKALKKTSSTARGVIVSYVVDDLIHECEDFPTAHAMWAHLQRMWGYVCNPPPTIDYQI